MLDAIQIAGYLPAFAQTPTERAENVEIFHILNGQVKQERLCHRFKPTRPE